MNGPDLEIRFGNVCQHCGTIHGKGQSKGVTSRGPEDATFVGIGGSILFALLRWVSKGKRRLSLRSLWVETLLGRRKNSR
jgi:hypothetical protein